MSRLLLFDVYRSRFPISELGPHLGTVEAATARDARALAQRLHPAVPVVVLFRSAHLSQPEPAK